ncbi:SDR family oxidoreductase [Neorhizobium galegae]|uniref:SDR family oxidoreductase n=1 Tax=Neorhizobium galegae TaxID=399 RepID=UPI00062259E7|nr:SDR family oxidoreductase [Neorhizobium galegae]CDZ54165.1 Putative UDP-glucose 4-epimerase [Neorhizobium galegae bv. orientalis]
MHVFVTGATGWVGSAVVEDLIGAGHTVSGLCRSSGKAATLSAIGATPVEGSLDDLGLLRATASTADAVIHTAFNHDDLSKFLENVEQDRRVIETLGEALVGSSRPLIVTSGLMGLPRGAREADLPNPAFPRKSEVAARSVAERGGRAATVRLAPSVHGIGDHGFVPTLIRFARQTGVSAYVDDGTNCWSGTHRRDAARVYRLALETGVTEAVYHAVAEESVPFRQIAEAIGAALGLPVESRPREHFGWFAHFAGSDMAASSVRTRALLGWQPREASLLSDLGRPEYYAG